MLIKLIKFYNFRLQALRLSQCALGETSPGKVVNLLSNDVSRFEYINLNMNSIWIAPLLALIVACLLYENEVGWPGLIGIATIFTIVPLQSTFIAIKCS